jgi:hypothetical protein
VIGCWIVTQFTSSREHVPFSEVSQAIYNNRAFERLPELADAFAEAGGRNPDFLSHCRGPGPHVRGCWVVDLVLGKE